MGFRMMTMTPNDGMGRAVLVASLFFAFSGAAAGCGDAAKPTPNTSSGDGSEGRDGSDDGDGSEAEVPASDETTTAGADDTQREPTTTESSMGGTRSESTTTSTNASASETTSDGFQVDLRLSSGIPTVGIVEWSFDGDVESAHVEFGRDSANFEFRAPVDLAAPGYRTVLLGMKPGTSYAVQVVVTSGGQTFASDIHTLETEFLPNGLPNMTVTADDQPTPIYGGFHVLCTGLSSSGGNGGGESWAQIFDQDAELVWAYDLTDTPAANCSRARLSYDGKSLWAGNFSNVMPTGALLRIDLDGETDPETFSFPGRHHDFAVLPNNNILFYEQANGGGVDGGGFGGAGEGPDIIFELDAATGMVTELYHQDRDFADLIAEHGAHTNQINYVPHLNAISFSMRHSSTIALISYPEAELLAVFGGPSTTFPEMDWEVQHGHQVLEDSLLVFNNDGPTGASRVLEYGFDLAASTASLVFEYSSKNMTSTFFGDVRQLPNGNILVVYSSNGIIQEIDSTGQLLREIEFETLGYVEHRKTLYGPPPPFAE